MITVHDIKATEALQKADDEIQTNNKQFNWYLIDATIKPQPVSTRFNHWKPSDLSLIRNPATGDTGDDDPTFWFAGCRVYMDEAFVDDDGSSCRTGASRSGASCVWGRDINASSA